MSAIPIYTMQTVLLPKAVCRQLDNINRNFLWGGDEASSSNHLVNWGMVCQPKSVGGLGLRQTRDSNVALLSKIGWAVEGARDSLAVKVLRSKYLLRASFRDCPIKSYFSNSWKGILRCRQCLDLGRKWTVGSGNDIKFWTDWWVGTSPLLSVAKEPVPGTLINTMVSNFISTDGIWDLETVGNILDEGIIEQIRAIPVARTQEGRDVQRWQGESDGSFSAKSAYLLLLQQKNGPGVRLGWIWSLKCPEKIKLFIWLLYLNKLNSNDNRVLKRMTVDGSCPRCGASSKSGLHIVRDCAFARHIWRRWEERGMCKGNLFSLPCAEWLKQNCLIGIMTAEHVSWNISSVSTIWALWNSRNKLIFQGKNDLAGDVWFGARKFAMEVMTVTSMSSTTLVREQRWVHWKRPAEGMFILNTDGAVKQDCTQASAGGLIRNSAGKWVKGFVVNIGATDSLFAELWGVREGLQLAKSLSLQPLIVELDASVVVHFLKEGVPSSHPCHTIVQDCICLMQGDWVLDVRHILRQGNQCADKLANLALTFSPGVTVLDEAPPELDQLLLADELELVTLRS